MRSSKAANVANVEGHMQPIQIPQRLRLPTGRRRIVADAAVPMTKLQTQFRRRNGLRAAPDRSASPPINLLYSD